MSFLVIVICHCIVGLPCHQVVEAMVVWGVVCVNDNGGGQVMVVVVEREGGSGSEVVVVADDNDNY